MRALLALLFGCALLFGHVAPALAQLLSTEVSSRQVEVGETFVVELTALVEADSERPSAPELKLPPGLVTTGPSVSTQSQVSILNGRISRRIGLTVTWNVVASKPGRYVVGPASVQISGKRSSDDPISIEVVPAGSVPKRAAPRRRSGFPFDFDPWDPFGSRSGRSRGAPDPFAGLDSAEVAPEEWRVEQAPDPQAFLIARASPKKVVVGQPVLLKVFVYSRSPVFDVVTASDPSRSGFLAYDVLPSSAVRRQRVLIGEEVFNAAQLQELLLVPLAPGKFSIGAMNLRLAFGRVGGQSVLERASQPVEVEVIEPPEQGRPLGYRLGDVGRFEIEAEVRPSVLEQGGASGVTVWVKGQGSFPTLLELPEQHGVVFSAPVVAEDISPRDGVLSGWRKFTYTVRFERTGLIELGSVGFSFYEPEQGYRQARASLGRVEVHAEKQPAGAERSTEQSVKRDALAELVATLRPRKVPQADPEARKPELTDSAWFVPLLVFPPFLVLLGRGLEHALRSLGRRWQAARRSWPAAANRELERARTLAASGDLQAVGCLEQAVFGAIEGATGLRARGVLRSQLGRELQARGVGEGAAEAIAPLLDRCDELRFAGRQPEALSELVLEVSAWVERFVREARR